MPKSAQKTSDHRLISGSVKANRANNPPAAPIAANPSAATLTKAALKQQLLAAGFDKEQACVLVHTFLQTLQDELVRGNKVVLQGIGSFAPYRKVPRAARNPKTGTPVMLDARAQIRFRVAQALKKDCLFAAISAE